MFFLTSKGFVVVWVWVWWYVETDIHAASPHARPCSISSGVWFLSASSAFFISSGIGFSGFTECLVNNITQDGLKNMFVTMLIAQNTPLDWRPAKSLSSTMLTPYCSRMSSLFPPISSMMSAWSLSKTDVSPYRNCLPCVYNTTNIHKPTQR